MSKAFPVTRGCGVRKGGAIYCEVPLIPFGRPLEDFLIDPPIVVDTEALGLSSVGIKLIKRANEGVYDIWDIIGQQFYPNVADFIEEARRFGISRRLAKTLDFSLLSDKSKIILLHQRAHIENHAEYFQEAKFKCPKEIGKHIFWPKEEPAPMCIGLWWEDVDGGEPWTDDKAALDAVLEEGLSATVVSIDDERTVRRSMPAFRYFAHSRPWKTIDGQKYPIIPEYKTAIFGAFPVGRLAVINDPEANTHEDARRRSRESQSRAPDG